MIFSRNKQSVAKPKAPKSNLVQEDDNIDDIVSEFIPQQPKPTPIQAPSSAMSGVKSAAQSQGQPKNAPQMKPMYFGGGESPNLSPPAEPTDPRRDQVTPGSLQNPIDAVRENQATAREAERAAAEQAAQAASQRAANRLRDRKMREREEEQGRDLNGDGKIGGRAMTQQDLFNQMLWDLLEEDPDRANARTATDDALRQAAAESTENMRAQTGLAGMGLSGAAGSAIGTEMRRGERERQLGLDTFDRNARQEDLARAGSAQQMLGNLQQMERFDELNAMEDQTWKTNIMLAEKQLGTDIDEDGFIGGVPVADVPTSREEQSISTAKDLNYGFNYAGMQYSHGEPFYVDEDGRAYFDLGDGQTGWVWKDEQ